MANWLTNIIKEIRPNATWDIIKWFGLGVVAMIGLLVTAIVQRLQGIPYDLIGIFVLGVVWFVIVIIGYFIGRYRSQRATPTQNAAENTKKLEDLTAQVKELEQEKTALEATKEADARTIEQQRTQLGQLQEEVRTQDAGISFRDDELNTLKTKYKWLHERADRQKSSISNYVELVEVRWCEDELDVPMLKSVFAIDIFNASVFDLTVEDVVGEYIEFEGTKLHEKPLITNLPIHIPAVDKSSITIEQRLSIPEAELIKSKDIRFSAFNFEHLIITIKGSERFPQVDPQPLKINHPCRVIRSHPSNKETEAYIQRQQADKASESEIALLKAEISSLQTKLDEFNKLAFEVDTKYESDMIVIPDTEFERPEYVIKAHLKIRFKNRGQHRTVVENMLLSLHQRGESSGERKIPLQGYTLEVYGPDEESFATINRYDFSKGIQIDGPDLTPYFNFHYSLQVSREKVQNLTQEHFLRLTMTTISEQSYSLDINVNWESAHNRSIFILSHNVGSITE